MIHIWCRIVGHRTVAVRSVGIVARPGGMLPSLDGAEAFRVDPEGDHLACVRCRHVLDAAQNVADDHEENA